MLCNILRLLPSLSFLMEGYNINSELRSSEKLTHFLKKYYFIFNFKILSLENHNLKLFFEGVGKVMTFIFKRLSSNLSGQYVWGVRVRVWAQTYF